VKVIGAQRERWGVEPICRILQVAPSTCYAAVHRPLAARRQRDEQLKLEIGRVHRDNFGVYGIEEVWRQLNREGTQVGRDRVARLMDEPWPRASGRITSYSDFRARATRVQHRPLSVAPCDNTRGGLSPPVR
jgi:transposase InsO family protein